MPTRSIALRLDLSDSKVREALWTTHRLVNEKARWFIEQLLILRGDEVWTSDAALAVALGHDGVITNDHGLFAATAEQVQGKLKARIQTWKPGIGDDETASAVKDLGRLYDLIVPTHASGSDPDSSGGDSGTLAKKWLKPLLDKTSVAFETEQKLAQAPPWTDLKREGAAWEQEARNWLSRIFKAFDEKRYSDESITAGYSKAAWFKAAKANLALDTWVPLFERAVADAQESPIGPLVSRLRGLGILDCLRDYQGFNNLLGDHGSIEMSKWDYLAFTRVLARLLSWESWNHRARKEHAARQAE